MSDTDTVQMEVCEMCRGAFVPGTLDFMRRCEPCFRIYLQDPPPAQPLLFQNSGNPHNAKETKAYVERLERKRLTPQGVDHNYVKRIYG